MNASDARTLAHWISPDYMVPAALAHSIDGTAVMGALEAFREARSLVRNYVRFMAWRDKQPLARTGIAMTLRAMGYAGRFQGVIPIEATQWRRTAIELAQNQPWPMPGRIDIHVGDASQFDCERAAAIAVSKMLTELPHTNRAILCGRLYQRDSAEVLVHFDPKNDEIFSAVLDLSRESLHSIDIVFRRTLKSGLKLLKHPMRPVGMQVLRSWARHGFIASPAGAMISLVGGVGIRWGSAPLCAANGVPLTASFGKTETKLFPLCLTVDHRVFDARVAGEMYEYLDATIRGLLDGR